MSRHPLERSTFGRAFLAILRKHLTTEQYERELKLLSNPRATASETSPIDSLRSSDD